MTASGHGFVHTAEGEYFIAPSKMGGAFDGDIVELAPMHVNAGHKQPQKPHAQLGNRPSARVVRVLDRAHESLIGRYEVAEPFGVVIPDDPRIPYDIFTMHADNPHVQDGDAVRVRIVTYPSRHEAALGVVEEVLGRADDEQRVIDAIIARHRLETTFSDAALEQAEGLTVGEARALEEGYRDLRERFVFTIDPADARDFDDALSMDREGDGFRLGVHIADVSHYVPWNSPIDIDARSRATSTYLVDRVIPMLPEGLSAGLCSLKPHEARRAMTVDLFLDADWNLTRCAFFPSLIESSARLTYDQAQLMLEGKDGGVASGGSGLSPIPGDSDLAQACNDADLPGKLKTLHSFAQVHARRREAAGGLDFETAEARAVLDEDGVPVDISIRKKTDSTSLIEEAMILANTAVARHLSQRKFPSIYRVHDAPAQASLADVVPILQEFESLKAIPVGDFVAGNPACIQQVLAAVKGRPEAELVSSLVLRSMQRAEYKSACSPHYGLALDEYTHFTSPIRRYPDLVVHRMFKAQLFGKSGTFEQQKESLDRVAEHSSKMERVAEAAARESQECKIIEYMQAFIGQTFPGVISGVASFGFFVRLENTVEGLVHLKNLGGEYFALDAAKHQLVGQDSGTVYRLGRRVQVVLKGASPKERKLDFVLK